MGSSCGKLLDPPQVDIPPPLAHRPLTVAQKRYKTVKKLCNGGLIQTSDLIGTCLEGHLLESIDRSYLIGLLSAQLIILDSYEYEPLLDFCVSKGFILDEQKWREVFFKALPEDTPLDQRLDFEVAFYRQYLITHPEDAHSIFKLARYIEKGVKIVPRDLLETQFERSPLHAVNANQLQAALYIKALSIMSNNTDALCCLAMCVEKGACLSQSDLKKIGLETNSNNKYSKILILNLYRKVIEINPTHHKALYYLAKYIFLGVASIKEANLLGTKFEGMPIKKLNQVEVAAALYRKILASSLSISSDKKSSRIYRLAIGQLVICIKLGIKLEGQDLENVGLLKQSLGYTDPNILLEQIATKGELENFKPIDQAALLIARHPKIVIPEDFMCPLSKRLMIEPVWAADGCIYDRASIKEWWQNTPTSPITGRPLAHMVLTPHVFLQSQIVEYLKNTTIPSSEKGNNAANFLFEYTEQNLSFLATFDSDSHSEKKSSPKFGPGSTP